MECFDYSNIGQMIYKNFGFEAVSRANARVSIDIPQSNNEVAIDSLHIGHARTILIGFFFARAHNFSFNIVLERLPKGFDYMPIYREIGQLLGALNITADNIYPVPSEDKQPELYWEDEFIITFVKSSLFPQFWYDTIVNDIKNAPTIQIRGTEFLYPEKYLNTSNESSINNIKLYSQMTEILAKNKMVYQYYVPIITVNGKKMAKHYFNSVPWRALEMFPSFLDRQMFLLSTACCPNSVVNCFSNEHAVFGFNADKPKLEPYEWNWNDLKEAVLIASKKH